MTVRTSEAVPGQWVVAENGTWLPGIYESDAVARRAARLPDAALLALSHIYKVDGENRPVTAADLDSSRSAP